MADDNKSSDIPVQGTGEANAGDLLSLWGGSGQKTAEPGPPQSQAPTEEPKEPSVKSVEPPKIPAQPSPSQTPPLTQKPELREQQKPQPKAKTELPPQVIHPSSETEKKSPRDSIAEIVEGEIISKAKTSKPTSQSIEEKSVEFVEEEEGFGSQLNEFLEELHLSKKHIFYGIGCLVLILFLIIGGIKGFRYFKNKKPSVQQEMVTENTGIKTSLGIGRKPSETLVKDTAINVSLILGQEQATPAAIEEYILTFRRMQNAYATNIDELLNASSDRRARLRSYLALLRKLREDGMNSSQKIQGELNSIKAAYEVEQKKQETLDANFFEQLDTLEAAMTARILESFIQSSVEIVSLRARFRALQKILDLYESGLPRLDARIRDIELNEESLVTGVKIYDVPGSDLNLILPTREDIQIPEARDGFNTPSFPLLPTHPSQVQTEKDFITKPGGGFDEERN